MTQEFFEKLEADLKSHHRKTFDYSQFEDLNHIGTGGFADVYSATFNGETYALKILKNNLKLEEFKTFRHEIKCLYTVDHQNIIKFHGISKGMSSQLCIVFDALYNLSSFTKTVEKKKSNTNEFDLCNLVQLK